MCVMYVCVCVRCMCLFLCVVYVVYVCGVCVWCMCVFLCVVYVVYVCVCVYCVCCICVYDMCASVGLSSPILMTTPLSHLWLTWPLYVTHSLHEASLDKGSTSLALPTSKKLTFALRGSELPILATACPHRVSFEIWWELKNLNALAFCRKLWTHRWCQGLPPALGPWAAIVSRSLGRWTQWR